MKESRGERKENGQILILFALMLAVLCGLTALSVDVGLVYVGRRDMQNASDAAALAAADVLLEGGTTGQAVAAGHDIAVANGYDGAEADVTVTVSTPPTSGPNQGDPDSVEVAIGQPVNALFATALGLVSWDVSARAVAAIDRTPKPYSIITLNSDACQATAFVGNVSVTINNAGTFTNSDCAADAFYTDGSVGVTTEVNDVVGGWVISGDVSPNPSRAGHYGDPLADIPEPTPITAPIQACPTFSGPPGSVVLQPGVYDCTIDPPGTWSLQFQPGDYHITGGIVADGGGSMHFGSGLYYLAGEGLIITGTGKVTGTGVTFYIEEGQTILTGTGDIDLSAPTSGPYEGILIFQNRSLTTTVEMKGNAITDGWGTVYAAAAQIHVVGNANTGFQFISDTFLTDGNTNLNITFFDSFLAAVPAVRLIE